MMLLPNLFQLCGPCYGSHQNVYALSFPNKQELILFDTGLVRYLIAMASLFLSAPVYKDSPEETK